MLTAIAVFSTVVMALVVGVLTGMLVLRGLLTAFMWHRNAQKAAVNRPATPRSTAAV